MSTETIDLELSLGLMDTLDYYRKFLKVKTTDLISFCLEGSTNLAAVPTPSRRDRAGSGTSSHPKGSTNLAKMR